MNNVVMWIVVAVAALIVFSTLARSGGDTSGEQAAELVANGAKLVDVRTPGEFSAGHIKGAVNIPVQVLGQRLAEVGSKDGDVVVYCRSGARSGQAKRLLNNAGFSKVHDMGGMSNWPEGAR